MYYYKLLLLLLISQLIMESKVNWFMRTRGSLV